MRNEKLLGFALRILVFLAVIAIGVALIFVVKAVLYNQPTTPRTEVEREIMDAEAAVKSSPTSVKARIMLSLAYSRAGRYNEAIEEASIAVKLDNNNATAYYALGVARSRAGDTEEAIAALNKCVKLNTGLADVYQQAYYELGEIYMREGKYKDAIKAYYGALSEGPEATYVVIALARAYEKAGETKNAIEQYRSILDYDPTNQEAKDALVRLGVKLKK
ncbi:MAG: tetratricopeptide repeat protein [Actinomycetota bacterium]|nr:tetratricopeptide repeat protein [Actinomycetota bacterium]